METEVIILCHQFRASQYETEVGCGFEGWPGPTPVLCDKGYSQAVSVSFHMLIGSLAKCLQLLSENHLPLTAMGLNPSRGFVFFHVR